MPADRLIALPLALSLAAPALALTPDDVASVTYEGGDLPDGQSALTMTVQVLLDRAGISPGIVDGYKGGMSESAIRAFEAREGFDADGVLDPEVWAALGGPEAAPVLIDYTVTEADAEGLVDAIPDDVRAKSEMESLGYVRVSERLAERFHMDEDVLIAFNEGTEIAPGATIRVADPGAPAEAEVARIEVRKAEGRAVAFDDDDAILVSYPVTIGSEDTPSPEGTVEVVAVAMDPTYSYDPEKNFVADGVEEALTLPPGPNGPVGTVWIDLSKPTFGLHGTDEPATLFKTYSHGCVRFTNWDVEELAGMVSQGVSVAFLE